MEIKQLNEEFWHNLNSTLSQSFVPPFSNETVRPCKAEDFKDFTSTVEYNLKKIGSSLDIIIKNELEWTKRAEDTLIKVIAVIGEQNKKSVWNTNEAVELSKLLSLKICNIYKSKSIFEIIKDDKTFLMIIRYLRPKLLKDTWNTFPAAVACYKWLLELVEKPLLKRHIPEIVPTALIIFDDYVPENRKLGLKCINTIIEHCQDTTSLKNFNYDEVIFQALKKMSRQVESDMIISLYSCISDLLANIEYCQNQSAIYGWSKRDEILSILLDNMELQSKPDYRYAYIMSLPKLLTCTNSGKWTDRLTRILSEYCENDIHMKTTYAALDFMETFLSMYQPQGVNFYVVMYTSLLKLRYNLISIEKETKKMIDKADKCISLLNGLCPQLSREIMENETVRSLNIIT